MSRPPPRSRSAISLASIISVTDPGPDNLYERILIVAVDNTENSVQALDWAANNLYRRGDKFSLVHVIPEPDTLHPWPGVYVPPDDALEREEFKEAISMIRSAFAPVVRNAQIPTDVHLIVAADNPDSIGSIIMDKAHDLHAAAIVVASHGKKGVQEFWVGSVTKKLTHESKLPVVVYRQHFKEQQSGGSRHRVQVMVNLVIASLGTVADVTVCAPNDGTMDMMWSITDFLDPEDGGHPFKV